ncbi:MAG TPA: hypothetical protein VE733_04715 [Streptosporangiaceae bacterium]|nr:hypothetical protein [Streptosporangiaceae bacterium]
MLQSAGLPAGSTPLYIPGLKPTQKARLDEANTALSGILARADDLHTRYLAAVQKADSQLDDAGNMAPHPPGFFASLWHDAQAIYDTTVHGLSEFVHNKALLEFISGVANVVATVAGLLALFPPLTAIFGPIALAAAGTALIMDMLLAGFDHGSWGAVALDAVAVVADAGWMKAAGKLADIYKESGLTGSMTQARTLTGLVTGKTADVAPGMFRMIGDSLKAAAKGEADATAGDLSKVKDFTGYSTWRAVDIVAGQASWSFSGAGIEAIPGNVRTWINDVAAGKTPWQESANKATGLG